MSDQEMKDIWMDAGGGKRISLDLSQLLVNLKGKMKKIDRTLFFRDAREIVAAVLVVLFFSYKSYVSDPSITKLAHGLIAIWGIYVIYRLLEVRKYKRVSDLNNSLKAQLLQQKMYLQKQAHLLDSALSWYIAPPAVLGMMVIVGGGYSTILDWGGILFSLIFIVFISWGIYTLNKKAAMTAYLPLIENINNVLIQLDEDLV